MGTIEKIARAVLEALGDDSSGPSAIVTPTTDDWSNASPEMKSSSIDLIERYASNLDYSVSRLHSTVDDIEAAKAQEDIRRLRLAARALRVQTPDYAPSVIIERNRATEELRARKASGGNIPLPDTTPHPTMNSGYRQLDIPSEGSFSMEAAPMPPDEPGFFALSTAQGSETPPPEGCPKPPEPSEGWGDTMIAHLPCQAKATQRTDNQLYQCPSCNMLSQDGSTWWVYIPSEDEETKNESDD